MNNRIKEEIRKEFKQKAENFLNQKNVIAITNALLIVVLGLTVSFLMTLHVDRLPQYLIVGAVATQDIKADQNYEILDKKATAKLKEEALEQVRPVYDFDPSFEIKLIDDIHKAFKQSRQFLISQETSDGNGGFSDEIESQLKKDFYEAFGIVLTDSQYQMIRQSQFDAVIESSLVFLAHEVMQKPIIHKLAELEALMEKGFSVRRLVQVEPYPEVLKTNLNNYLDVESAKAKIKSIKLSELEKQFDIAVVSRKVFVELKEIATKMIKINLNYNNEETLERKKRVAENIKNVIIKIKRGESIIRSGDRFESWHLSVIEGVREKREHTNFYLKFAGIFIFVNLVLFIVYFYSSKYIKKFRPKRKDLIFLGFSLVVFLVVLRIGVFLSAPFRDSLGFDWAISMFYYAIPVAGGAMLVRFILNSETALVFSVVISLFSGFFLEHNLELTVYYLISGVFAAHAIAHVDKRSTVLKCGAYAGLVNALTIFSLNLLGLMSVAESITPTQVMLNCMAGFVGGIFTSMIVLILTPVSENIFNYTTDIKLLELATLSHPLLKEMIVRTPGTYHHSQIVGVLAEGGAQAIGANPLLARVASYYHDIGKMKKPQYFIENQKGDNPHDKLAPSMSALIISAHVKDGIEMAKEHKLPKKIADMIPEHQGTKLIGYFYDKAKKQSDPNMDQVHERDYRYPGPRPQSREAGVIMLADTIEAAVRSLPEKSPFKIKQTVEKLVNNHFIDEQLDECDLTLRDLHRIEKAFIDILNGIYHHRVEYPEQEDQGAEIHLLHKKQPNLK